MLEVEEFEKDHAEISALIEQNEERFDAIVKKVGGRDGAPLTPEELAWFLEHTIRRLEIQEKLALSQSKKFNAFLKMYAESLKTQ